MLFAEIAVTEYPDVPKWPVQQIARSSVIRYSPPITVPPPLPSNVVAQHEENQARIRDATAKMTKVSDLITKLSDDLAREEEALKNVSRWSRKLGTDTVAKRLARELEDATNDRRGVEEVLTKLTKDGKLVSDLVDCHTAFMTSYQAHLADQLKNWQNFYGDEKPVRTAREISERWKLPFPPEILENGKTCFVFDCKVNMDYLICQLKCSGHVEIVRGNIGRYPFLILDNEALGDE